MKRRFAVPAALLLGLTVLLSACAPATGGEGAPSVSPTPTGAASAAPSGNPAPGQSVEPQEAQAGILSSFTATGLDGGALDQTMLEGYDLTMVNVWATFCGPCLREMPDLGELAAEYADRGVQIVGMVSDVLDRDGTPSEDQLATARDIVESTGADYPHIVPGEDLFGLLGQISAVPTTFFVNSAGEQVGYAVSGAREKADWITIIDAALEDVGK